MSNLDTGMGSLQQQRGFSLMESLVTVVLVSLLSLGLLYGLAKAVRQQGAVSAQSVVINDLRGRLQQAGIAGNCSTSGTSSTETVSLKQNISASFTRSCIYNAITMTVTGTKTFSKTVVHPSVAFTGSDSRLGSASLIFSN